METNIIEFDIHLFDSSFVDNIIKDLNKLENVKAILVEHGSLFKRNHKVELSYNSKDALALGRYIGVKEAIYYK